MHDNGFLNVICANGMVVLDDRTVFATLSETERIEINADSQEKCGNFRCQLICANDSDSGGNEEYE